MTEQPWRGLSAEVARLQGQADAVQARFDALADDLAVVADAEGTVARLRQDEFAAAQRTAWRRVAAARGRLTRAQRGGDPDAIRAARDRLDARHAEADDLAHAGITEMQQISRVSLAHAGTAAAVTEAVQAHTPETRGDRKRAGIAASGRACGRRSRRSWTARGCAGRRTPAAPTANRTNRHSQGKPRSISPITTVPLSGNGTIELVSLHLQLAWPLGLDEDAGD